jgi:hypothetical protein
LDLVADTLGSCRIRIDEALPRIQDVRTAVDEQRGLLARHLAGEMRTELLANRRQWENRLLAQTASRWGFSPFALVLRVYQGIGGLLAGALLYRARTPAQMALLGAMEGVHAWRRHLKNRQADQGIDRTASGAWDSAELRKAALIVEGYVSEAGLERRAAQWETVSAEAESAAKGFVMRVSADLESLVARLAKRHTGWCTRWRYELMLALMLGLLLYRLGKNFFYDSWLSDHHQPVFGLDVYVSSGLWLVLWCLILLWSFCSRLRGGLRDAIGQLAAGWQDGALAAGIFTRVENDCRSADHFRQELDAMQREVHALQRQIASGRE